jgi:hypothetical protein
VTREQILTRLLKQIGESGLWMMGALQKAGKPMPKERLRIITNEHRRAQEEGDMIRSRHTLDQISSKLEGAGMIDIECIGRTKMYTLSDLGEELIRFRKEQRR